MFEGPDGGPVRHSNWYPRHFKPAVVRAGLPERTRFHDLRHTYAAMLIAQGAHPRAMMERLGHSTIQVTLGTYGHLFPGLEESLDDALNTVFSEARPTPGGQVRGFGSANGAYCDAPVSMSAASCAISVPSPKTHQARTLRSGPESAIT